MNDLFAIEHELGSGDIKRIRKILDCTQQEFADFSGVSKKTVERWESGKGRINGPVTVLIKILEEDPQLFDYYRIPKKELPLRLWYMFRERICTIIDVDNRKRMVRIRNYTEKPLFRAFGRVEHPTYDQYEAFLESRCFSRSIDKEKIILRELGIPFYDPFLIIQKTQGRMAEDEFWIRIER